MSTEERNDSTPNNDSQNDSPAGGQRQESRPSYGGGGDRRDYSDRGDRGDDRSRGRGNFRGGPGAAGRGGRSFFRRKVCKFCTQSIVADYKRPDIIRRFVTERGKILPRRITGTCAKHQRSLSNAVKRARVLAFLPFSKH